VSAPPRQVVYCTVAVANDGLVFAAPERAREVARIDRALSEGRSGRATSTSRRRARGCGCTCS
jgi:hypothetical protein